MKTRVVSSAISSAPPRSRATRQWRLGILLRRAWFSLNQAFRRRCAKVGLTPDQYTALRTLVEGGSEGLTQTQLVEAMCSDPNTVTSLLKRMEAGGWIERRPHETDRRVHRVALLAAGRRKFNQIAREAVALQQAVLGGLDETERDAFLKQLEAVAEACQEILGKRATPEPSPDRLRRYGAERSQRLPFISKRRRVPGRA